MSIQWRECIYKKIGEAVMLFPVDKEWEVFLHGLNSFSDDFMSEGRFQGIDQEWNTIEDWAK